MIFLTLLALPLLVAGLGFVFLKGVTLLEFFAQAAAQLLVAGVSMAVVSCANTADVEILNGRVTGKTRDKVSCSHSYQCNCHQVCSRSGQNRSCSRVCQTCYHHAYDVDWNVSSTVGSTTIARVDWQGLDQPERWSRVSIGEPFARQNSYENFVKAAPDTLFRHQGLVEKYAGRLPGYPSEVFDYYRLDRLVLQGVSVPSRKAWNEALAEAAADVGRSRQANLVVALTNLPREYFSALEQHWIGGKKNDVILVAGVDRELRPEWAEVMAWTDFPIVKIKIRDDVLALAKLEPVAVADVLRKRVLADYKRKPMGDFEYLAATVTPTPLQYGLSIFFGVLIAAWLAWFFHREDPFNQESAFR